MKRNTFPEFLLGFVLAVAIGAAWATVGRVPGWFSLSLLKPEG